MKKCPFCKADIEDNARFCLYCMKPLNEKEVISPPQGKTLWWPFAVGGLLLLLVVLLLIGNGQSDSAGSSESSFSISNTTQSAPQSPQGTEHTPSEDSGTQNPQQSTGPSQTPAQTPNNESPEPSENTQPVTTPEPSTGETPDETTGESTEGTPGAPTGGATGGITEEPSPVEPTGGTTEEPPDETVEPETPTATVVYQYRAARAGDDFSAHYSNAGNDIVITGISQPAADGIYDIPDYIDGKKVIAIVANAFYGSDAKIIYVPATVKSIWRYAFNGCALTDIYFRGNALYVESKAFDGTLTIHCSSTCNDRNLRYYKDSATSYGAVWEEWDGSQ